MFVIQKLNTITKLIYYQLVSMRGVVSLNSALLTDVAIPQT